MGLAVGDYRNNGRLDLYTTTFSDDYGDANFVDITPQMGIAEATYPFLSWGTQFFDYDNDGWKDLMFVSGHVYPQVDQHEWGTSWAERSLLFHNLDRGKKFEMIPPVEGTGLADVLPARGAAFGDLFNDGKIDVVINCIDHTPVLLRNVSDDHNHWFGLLLIGGPKSLPVSAFAANNCPWMNEATASALFGGGAVGAYSPPVSNHPAECTFTETDTVATRVLKISVEIAQGDSHAQLINSEVVCGSKSVPLKAIGNEAVACAIEGGTDLRGVRALGRVRDQVFEILITTTRSDDPILAHEELRIRIKTAAEQVSGNLF
jgi:hypothetical protein